MDGHAMDIVVTRAAGGTRTPVTVRRGRHAVQLGLEPGVVVLGLSEIEADLLMRPGQVPAGLRTEAGRHGIPPERAGRLAHLVEELTGGRPVPTVALGLADVVVDGAGAVATEITTQLRRVGVGRVGGGHHAAAAAEALDGSHRDPRGTWGRRPQGLVLVGGTPPDPEVATAWHARGASVLPVTVATHAVTVGPLSLPGVSSCLRCHELTRSDLDRDWPAVAARLRPGPADAAIRPADPPLPLTLLAAAVAVTVLVSALSGSLELGGISTELRAGEPTVTHRHWPRHAGCVCGDVAAG